MEDLRRSTERVGDLGATPTGPAFVRSQNGPPCTGHGVAPVAGRAAWLEQGHELGHGERALATGPAVGDRGREVEVLETEHEVRLGEIDVPDAPRAVAAEIEVERRSELERFGQHTHGAEIECAGGRRPNGQALREPPQHTFSDRAPEAVSGADEDDIEGLAGHRLNVAGAYPARVSIRFSVVIPTLARPEPLHETLDSVLACDPPADEVIVVDADPESSASAVAAPYGDRVRVLPSRRGLTIQRNRALDVAAGEVVVFLDDDVEVDPGLFAGLAATFRDRTIVGATGRVVEPDLGRRGGTGSSVRRLILPGDEGRFTRAGYPRRLTQLDQEADIEFMHGCFMSVRRELAARVRFDEALADYGLGEDEDFAYRVSRHGRIRYVPSLRVVHKNLGFTSKDQREFGRLVIRNRSYLFRKNFPQTLRARAEFALLVGVLVAHRLANREWRGALGLVEGAAAELTGRR